MKKGLLSLVLACFFVTLFAQDDMPVVWETKLEHKIDYSGTALEEDGYVYAADQKKLSIVDNKTGKVKWCKKFKELAPDLRKIDELIPFWKSKTMFLFDKKMGKDKIACIDIERGKFLWGTEKYQNLSDDVILYIPNEDGFIINLKKEMVFVKARTGEEVWSNTSFKGVVGRYIYNEKDRTIVMVNFVPGGLAHFFTGFKNQIAKINMKNGEVIWESEYTGRARRKAVSREFIYSLDKVDDKVFLRLNGLQVYDLKTGANLWSAAFNFQAEDVVKKPKGKLGRYSVTGAVAEPVIDGEDIYILDMSDKKNQYVKKYDMNTGKLLWTSPEIHKARAIPEMYVVDDKVILQIGGIVERQYITTYKSGDEIRTVHVIDFPKVKPFGVKAYNTKDGSFSWESEKFRKGITNALLYGDNLIVSSGKALYSIGIKDGKDNYEVPAKKGGVGNATQIQKYKDQIVIIGEKGISLFNAKDGKKLCANKYSKCKLDSRKGDILVLKRPGKGDIATFDLSQGCKYKEFKGKKGTSTWLTEGADFIYAYEKKNVSKLKTR